MRRKKRRTKYTWFPTAWTQGAGGSDHRLPGIDFALGVDSAGTITTGIIPLTADAPKEPADNDPRTTTGILPDIVGQEYFLKRIVGKFHIAHVGFALYAGGVPTEGTITTFPNATIVGAGIFVARADDLSAGGVDLPVGATVGATLREQYSPLHVNTIREPWVWRRTWILGNPLVKLAFQRGSLTAVNGFAGGFFPPTTAGYGSIQDGPHVDAKTARRVSNDDRLWLAVSTQTWPVNTAFQTDTEIRGHFDYRILAQLRRAFNRGVF